jgi:hypothetical protein
MRSCAAAAAYRQMVLDTLPSMRARSYLRSVSRTSPSTSHPVAGRGSCSGL